MTDSTCHFSQQSAEDNLSTVLPGSTGRFDRVSYEPAHGRVQVGGRRRSSQNPNPSRRLNKPLIVLGVFALVLCLVYAGGCLMFMGACYPNTKIADVDVSLMRKSTAVSRIRTAAEGYRLTIKGEGFEWTFDPESAHEVIDAEQTVSSIIDANEPLIWPVRLYESLTVPASTHDEVVSRSKDDVSLEDIPLPAEFDREAFAGNLGAAVDAFNEGRPGTFDAVAAYDEAAGKLTLDRALSNRKLDKDAILRTALLAVSTLDKTVELGEESYIPLGGGASEEELQAALDAANALMGARVDIKMGGSVVGVLDGPTFVHWLTFDENLKPTLSTEPLAAWVRELAKAKLDTVGTRREYKRPDGKTVMVSGGTYGWNSNEPELVRLLNEAISQSHTGEVEVPVLQKARVWTDMGQKDWGAYCDIDLSEQRCRYYDETGRLLWESFCITGNPNNDDPTPTGVYALNAKRRDVTLIGFDEDDDGEPDYESPVDFWMPFIDNVIGLHDASWQPDELFSDPAAYLSRGSKGCVNLPADKAAELFDLIQVGDCVVVHD